MFKYNAGCAERYRSQLDGLYTGDQANVQDLERALARGPYQVIIDDGGHTMRQWITSLRVLLPRLPPGGVYVLEDLSTSWGTSGYMDMPNKAETAHMFVADVLQHLHRRSPSHGQHGGLGRGGAPHAQRGLHPRGVRVHP
jgi:hypothetical protein